LDTDYFVLQNPFDANAAKKVNSSSFVENEDTVQNNETPDPSEGEKKGT